MSYNSKKDSTISLKSTEFERGKIQKVLELLSKTVDDAWKTISNFNITVSQRNLNKWSISSDIRNLDNIITIPIL